MMASMLHIGLTGGIASGKTTACAYLQKQYGVAVVDADAITHRLLQHGQPECDQVLAAFGDAMATAAGDVDRAKLGELVFRDKAARQRLENILHPAILREIQFELGKLEAQGDTTVIVAAPLLLELGLEDLFPLVILLLVDTEMQKKRLLEQRKISAKEAKRRIQAQMDNRTRQNIKNCIKVFNNGTLKELYQRLDEVWQEIANRRVAKLPNPR